MSQAHRDETNSSEARYPFLHLDVPLDNVEQVSMRLWDAGALGVEERDATTLDASAVDGHATLVASFAEASSVQALVDMFCLEEPSWHARIEVVVGDAWRDAWRDNFKPTRVGKRLVLCPSWETTTLWPHEVLLTIDPGNAFGSGIHETTRLCLREIDRRIQPGDTLLDVGCGSGILSVAALLLGASHADATDIDADAIRVTHKNATLNNVSEQLHASTTLFERTPRKDYAFVVANIQAWVLREMAEVLSAHVCPHGTLVLSGILLGEQDHVLEAFPQFTHQLTSREGEWVALVLTKSRPTSS